MRRLGCPERVECEDVMILAFLSKAQGLSLTIVVEESRGLSGLEVELNLVGLGQYGLSASLAQLVLQALPTS